MNGGLHLITTDVSCFDLIRCLNQGDSCSISIIIPSNRKASEKVQKVYAAAEKHGIKVFEHQSRHLFPDGLPPASVAVSWLYSQIILPEDIHRYPDGILNMHGGFIPEYRGASVLHWAMINGEKEIGVTWHEIVEQVDAGPIWHESSTVIGEDMTALDARDALITEGLRTFPFAWEAFRKKNVSPRIPDLSQGKVWRQRRPEDGFLETGLPEKIVRDFVRTLCPPWPPAYVKVGAEYIHVDKVCSEPHQGLIPYQTAEAKTLYLRPCRNQQSAR